MNIYDFLNKADVWAEDMGMIDLFINAFRWALNHKTIIFLFFVIIFFIFQKRKQSYDCDSD
jgi:hypothetical protein